MPTVRSLSDRNEELMLSRSQREERSKKLGVALLPEEFTGQVYFAARAEAEKVKGRLVEIEDQLKIVKNKLSDARRQVLSSAKPIFRQRWVGSILDLEEELVNVPAGAFQLTPDALATRKKIVLPLQREQLWLEAEKTNCQQQVGELKRIASAAFRGEISLIHYLSDMWRSRLEIGAGLVGKLPPAAKKLWLGNVLYTDAAGNPLPPEALDPETKKPDLAPGMRGSEIRKS